MFVGLEAFTALHCMQLHARALCFPKLWVGIRDGLALYSAAVLQDPRQGVQDVRNFKQVNGRACLPHWRSHCCCKKCTCVLSHSATSNTVSEAGEAHFEGMQGILLGRRACVIGRGSGHMEPGDRQGPHIEHDEGQDRRQVQGASNRWDQASEQV